MGDGGYVPRAVLAAQRAAYLGRYRYPADAVTVTHVDLSSFSPLVGPVGVERVAPGAQTGGGLVVGGCLSLSRNVRGGIETLPLILLLFVPSTRTPDISGKKLGEHC